MVPLLVSFGATQVDLTGGRGRLQGDEGKWYPFISPENAISCEKKKKVEKFNGSKTSS